MRPCDVSCENLSNKFVDLLLKQLYIDKMVSTPKTTPVEASGNQMEEKPISENRHGKRTHRTQSRSNQRGNTHVRGAPGGRNKKSDMGRAEWRYVAPRYLFFFRGLIDKAETQLIRERETKPKQRNTANLMTMKASFQFMLRNSPWKKFKIKERNRSERWR